MNASAYFKRRAAMSHHFRDHYGGSRPFGHQEVAAQNHLLEEQVKSEARIAAENAKVAKELELKARTEAEAKSVAEAKARAEAEAAAAAEA